MDRKVIVGGGLLGYGVLLTILLMVTMRPPSSAAPATASGIPSGGACTTGTGSVPCAGGLTCGSDKKCPYVQAGYPCGSYGVSCASGLTCDPKSNSCQAVPSGTTPAAPAPSGTTPAAPAQVATVSYSPKPNSGETAGIVIGVLALVGVLGGAVWYARRQGTGAVSSVRNLFT